MSQYSILDKHLLFDTGVIKDLFQSEAKYRRFWESLSKVNFYKNDFPFLISTPLMSFEYLGYNLINFDPYNLDPEIKKSINSILMTIKDDSINECVEIIAEKIFGWLRMHPELQPVKLHKKYEAELKSRSVSVKKMFEQIIGNRFDDPNNYTAFITDLANDRIQALPYADVISNKKLIKQIDLYFIKAIAQNLEAIARLPIPRLSDVFCARAKRIIEGKAFIKFPYSPQGEILDTEIVHYSVMGHFNQAKRSAVVVFTREKIQKWIPRINRYIEILSFLNEYQIKINHQSLIIRPGLIFQVNEMGEVCDNPLDLRSKFNFDDKGLIIEQDLIWKNHYSQAIPILKEAI